MSNYRAIAAVTSMLDYLITQGSGAPASVEKVTTRPPDKARTTGAGESQINIFLYQTAPNAAWRNREMPGRTRPGETGAPPLALNLYYLITAYGKDDNDVSAHLLLGHAMQMLHDHSVISRADMETASTTASLEPDQQNALLDADLRNQVEQLRITPVPLPLDELSRLWSTFQTPYRLSAAYEVSVLLIESAHRAKTPLPVLTRGPGDAGVSVQPHLLSALPRLETVIFPNQEPSLRLGETLGLQGAQLAPAGGSVVLHFKHVHLSSTNELKVKDPSASAVQVEIAGPEQKSWSAGLYTVTAQATDANGISRTSNALSFALAPTILTINKPVVTDSSLTVVCTPAIAEGQRVYLLLGDRELPLQNPKEQSYPLTQPTFSVENVESGEYFVRLRVDGVDSHLIDQSKRPPAFDKKQMVTL